MTAGVALNTSNACLIDGRVNERVQTPYNNRQQKVLESERKKKKDLAKLQSKVMQYDKKLVILQSGMLVSYKQGSPGSKGKETASFHNARNMFHGDTYSLVMTPSKSITT